jgi:L-lysine 2,3-aminomutase
VQSSQNKTFNVLENIVVVFTKHHCEAVMCVYCTGRNLIRNISTLLTLMDSHFYITFLVK